MNAILNVGLSWVIFECSNPTSNKNAVIIMIALVALSVTNLITGYSEGNKL